MPGGWNSVHGDAVATSDEAETLRGLMHAILEMLDDLAKTDHPAIIDRDSSQS